MKLTKDELIFPSFRTIGNVEWDEEGFRQKGTNELILWSDVVQVALVFEIHRIAILDWDYIGFRLKKPELSVWVEVKLDGPFVAEIERRFARIYTPRMADWADAKMCIRAYTIWPKELVGDPLYVNWRKHWWSSETLLALRKRPNQAPEPTPGSVTPRAK